MPLAAPGEHGLHLVFLWVCFQNTRKKIGNGDRSRQKEGARKMPVHFLERRAAAS